MTSLLHADARMISASDDSSAFVLSAVITLTSNAPVRGARLRGTAWGLFEVTIDGTPISDGVLAPGWSAYDSRLPVETYDITSWVREGMVVDVLVGNGWWRGKLGFGGGCRLRAADWIHRRHRDRVRGRLDAVDRHRMRLQRSPQHRRLRLAL